MARFAKHPRLKKGAGYALVVTLPGGAKLQYREEESCPGAMWSGGSFFAEAPFDLAYAVEVTR